MAIDSVTGSAASQVTGAIRNAARSTGTSFEYLLTTAQIESNLNPAAQATTSSAKGLYQFIDQTWLATMKQAGPALGLGRYADAISQNSEGHYEVPDPIQRAAIMRLRSDPTASAMMAGAFTRTNAAQLAGAIGRQPTEGELYIAHFLGSDGASKLINVAAAQPRANAAAMFPQAASANPSIFKSRSGQPRSASEVYAKLTGRFEVARAMTFSPGLRGSTPAQATPPDTAGVTQAFAQAHAQANDGQPRVPDTRPLFQTMFTDRASTAVAQTVSNLWAPAKSGTPAEPARPLDLFTDMKPDTRKLLGGKA
jgi:hypothetical protein